MKYLLFLSFSLFFIGCGGSSSIGSDSNGATNDLFYQQWYLDKDSAFYSKNSVDDDAHINPNNNLSSYTGKGIKVAVIDDGFDVYHPQIKDNIIATATLDGSGNLISSDVSHTDSKDNHGTAVAGIIAAKDDNIGTRGIAPNVELILIKYPTSSTDSGTIALFEKALEYDADIINCSWGTNAVSDTVRSYINGIANSAREGKGVIIVFSSGNDNINMQNDESSIANVIGVGATDKDNLRTSYSNYGKELDIMAPGGSSLGIATLDPLSSKGSSSDEYNRYNQTNNGRSSYFIGTSASAPVMSGVLALALEKTPSLTRERIQDILKYSTSQIGQNVPYLDEMTTSSSQTPTITGILGSSGNSNIKVRLTNNSTSTSYGTYSISVAGNNTFTSSVTDTLPEGNYTIELLNNSLSTVYATDENFEVNTTKSDSSSSTIRKNNFYGYGKIDLDKFLGNI